MLAYSFGVHLIRPKTETMETMTKGTKAANAITQVLINNTAVAFSSAPVAAAAAGAPPPPPPKKTNSRRFGASPLQPVPTLLLTT